MKKCLILLSLLPIITGCNIESNMASIDTPIVEEHPTRVEITASFDTKENKAMITNDKGIDLQKLIKDTSSINPLVVGDILDITYKDTGEVLDVKVDKANILEVETTINPGSMGYINIKATDGLPIFYSTLHFQELKERNCYYSICDDNSFKEVFEGTYYMAYTGDRSCIVKDDMKAFYSYNPREEI